MASGIQAHQGYEHHQPSRLSIELTDERGRNHDIKRGSRQGSIHRSKEGSISRHGNSRENSISTGHTRENSRENSLSRIGSRDNSRRNTRDLSGTRYSTQRPELNKRFSKTSDLLHTAINQNHHLKSNLTRSVSAHNLSTKNIPMGPLPGAIPDTNGLVFKKWNSSYQVDKDKSFPEYERRASEDRSNLSINTTSTGPTTNNDSVSPLTVLKDQYNIRRPEQYKHPIPGNTDNSFDLLSTQTSNQEDTLTTTEAKPSKTLLNRMSQIVSMAHNSMHSLAPMFSHNKPRMGEDSGVVSNYQSESDDSDEENEEEQEEDDSKFTTSNGWKTGTEPQNIDLSPDPTNFQDIMNEINDFQSTFVDKFNSAPTTQARQNRTQQRILDYKELYSFDSSSTLNTMATPSLSTSVLASSSKPPTSAISILNSYSVRIQCETIISQYTSIRLRFGSKAASSSSRKLSSDTGILGFLNRVQFLKSNGNGWWSSSVQPRSEKEEDSKSMSIPNIMGSDTGEKPDPQGSITFENKDEILKRIWDSEIQQLFHETETDAESTTGSLELDPVGIYSKSESTTDFGLLARNVKLRS